ncbi:MAG: class I SAM-dependent methyltransferase [Pseudomonadota bacterium]
MHGNDVEHWRGAAADWIAWARTPGHDAFWAYRDALAALIGPGDGAPAVDIGCGEGRVSRLLGDLGWTVSASDGVAEMAEAARDLASAPRIDVAPANALPYKDAAFSLVLLYNCLMDIEDLDAALAEARRVAAPSARVFVSLVHPVADLLADDALLAAHRHAPGARSYFDDRPIDAQVASGGLAMHFSGWARPLTAYTQALARAGFADLRLHEPAPSDDAVHARHAKWARLPLFLWMEARAA